VYVADRRPAITGHGHLQIDKVARTGRVLRPVCELEQEKIINEHNTLADELLARSRSQAEAVTACSIRYDPPLVTVNQQDANRPGAKFFFQTQTVNRTRYIQTGRKLWSRT
jgi:hypothetical protein